MGDRKISDNIWEQFFDGQSPVYMDNVFTKATDREIPFLLEILQLAPGSRILDVGCGTGRHAVELARRGFKITGVDISSGMLAEARKAAEKTGVTLELIHGDATKLELPPRFDAVLCLCEGAFALLGHGDDPIEHDLAVLRGIHGALKPGKRLVLDTLNASEKIRRYQIEDIRAGRFDPVDLVETFELKNDTSVEKKNYTLREKGYTGIELKLLLRLAEFQVEHIWGSHAGRWRKEPPEPDEMGIMAIAHKL